MKVVARVYQRPLPVNEARGLCVTNAMTGQRECWGRCVCNEDQLLYESAGECYPVENLSSDELADITATQDGYISIGGNATANASRSDNTMDSVTSP